MRAEWSLALEYKRREDEFNGALKSKAKVAGAFGIGLAVLEALAIALPGPFPVGRESLSAELGTLTISLIALSLACLGISGLYRNAGVGEMREEVRRDRVARGAEVTALAASICSVVWCLGLVWEVARMQRLLAAELLIVAFLGTFSIVLAAVAPDSFRKNEVLHLRLDDEVQRLVRERDEASSPLPAWGLAICVFLLIGGVAAVSLDPARLEQLDVAQQIAVWVMAPVVLGCWCVLFHYARGFAGPWRDFRSKWWRLLAGWGAALLLGIYLVAPLWGAFGWPGALLAPSLIGLGAYSIQWWLWRTPKNRTSSYRRRTNRVIARARKERLSAGASKLASREQEQEAV